MPTLFKLEKETRWISSILVYTENVVVLLYPLNRCQKYVQKTKHNHTQETSERQNSLITVKQYDKPDNEDNYKINIQSTFIGNWEQYMMSKHSVQ